MVDKYKPKGMGLDKQEPETENVTKFNFKKYLNRKTLAIGTMSALALGGLVVSTNAEAQEVIKTTTNEVTVAVMKTRHSSSFANKEVLQGDEKIQAASDQAMSQITATWTDNTAEEIRAEVERQREAGLDAYVVQWGDTLSVLAEVISVPVDELVARNNISDRHLILAGDILDGVLYQTTNEERLTDDDVANVSTDLSHLEEVEADGETRDTMDMPRPGLGGESGLVENPDESVSSIEDTEEETKVDTKDIKDEDRGNFGPAVGDIVDDEDNPVNDIQPVRPSQPMLEKPTEAVNQKDMDSGVDPVTPEQIELDKDNPDVFVGEDPDVEPLEVPEEEIDAYVVTVSTDVVEEVLKFKTETIEDDTLYADVRVVEVSGLEGRAVTETEVSTLSDGSTQRGESQRRVVSEPINEVVRVGTIPVEVVEHDVDEYVREVSVPTEIQYVEVDDLLPGVERIVTEGKNGLSYEKVKVTVDANGFLVSEEILEANFKGEYDGVTYDNIVEMTPTVIEVGKAIPYDTTEESTQELEVPTGDNVVEVDAGVPLVDENNEPIVDENGEPITLKSGEEYIAREGSNTVINQKVIIYFKEEDEVYREVINTGVINEEDIVHMGEFGLKYIAK